MPSADTSLQAYAIQLQVQGSMSAEQRLLLAFEMGLFARKVAKTQIRREHPQWPETRIVRELIRLALLPAPLPG